MATRFTPKPAQIINLAFRYPQTSATTSPMIYETGKIRTPAGAAHRPIMMILTARIFEINKQAAKNKRIIDCLLQVYIADEDTKFGLGFDEVIELLRDEAFAELKNIRIVGLMGIATNTKNEKQITTEFHELKVFFDGIKVSFFRKDDAFKEISTGMSADYKIAIEEVSTMVRIGSSIFGKRIIKHFKNDITTN